MRLISPCLKAEFYGAFFGKATKMQQFPPWGMPPRAKNHSISFTFATKTDRHLSGVAKVKQKKREFYCILLHL